MEKDSLTTVPESSLVVAYDGSPTAQHASRLAIELAHHQQLSLRGLYVIDVMLILDTYSSYQAELGSAAPTASRAELEERFRVYGESILGELASQCQAAGVTFTSTIELGGVSEIVRQEAAHSPLLALGRRGHSHPEHDALGQHFRALAHHAPVPLLVGGDEARPLRRVLLAYNASERAQGAATWAALLQRTIGAQVEVLIVEETTLNRRGAEAIDTQLAQRGLANCQVLRRSGQPSTLIVETAASQQSDLIVMGGYRHGALLEWLMGSTVDQVLRATPLPVLIV
jgi:nucleotide-binding universal stress UspA family protein